MKKVVVALFLIAVVPAILCVVADAESGYIINDGIIMKIIDDVIVAAYEDGRAFDIRTVTVNEINVFQQHIILIDEDGFIWPFWIGEYSVELGQEYTLLSHSGRTLIAELPEAQFKSLFD